jgi:hypothetical protein
MRAFDAELWAATPYDTITLGPHRPGPGTIVLAKGDDLMRAIRARITNTSITVEQFAAGDGRATRDAVQRRLASIPELWRLHDAKPGSNLDTSDLAKQQKVIQHMPVWVTSAECVEGVQILGDKGPAITATRPAPEPLFMTELWTRNLHLGLHMTSAVERIHGQQSPGGESNGLRARLAQCAETHPAQVDLLGEWVIDDANSTYREEPNGELSEVIAMKQETIKCSSWVGLGAKNGVAADRLVCRAIWTKDELVGRNDFDYAWQLASHILAYAMYVDARVANVATTKLSATDLGKRLWMRVYGAAAASARLKPSELAPTSFERLARAACASGSASDWDKYMQALAPLALPPSR